MPLTLTAFGASFLFAIASIAFMLKTGFLTGILDHPNQRSLHSNPVPRTGGLALIAGGYAGWALVGITPVALFWCSAVLVVISALDDIYSLKVLWRFAGHFAAAITFVFWGMSLALPYPLACIVIVTIVWMTNLFNFMDGSDGLAGGMALFGFGFYAIAAGLVGDIDLAIAAACLSTAALGFLFYNFHPAKIFMGDAGSIPLGFLAAALGLIGWQRNDWPLWFPILIFSPFIVDATVTLMKRALRGEKIWHAHREHYYQRLVRGGFGHQATAVWEYGLMLSCGLSALFARSHNQNIQLLTLLIWSLIYIAIAISIDRYWKKITKDVHAK